MLAVSDRAALPLAHEPREFFLALEQRHAGQVTSVAMEKVEYIIDETFTLTRFERGLERRKTGKTVLVLDHDLAVDQRRARREGGDGARNVGKFFGPIETLAGEQAHAAAIQPRLHAIAVEFDFVHPARAARRVLAQRRQRRGHELGQRRAARTRLFVSAVVFLAGGLCAHAARAVRIPAGDPRPARALHRRTAPHRSRLDVIARASVGMPDPLAALAFGDLRDRPPTDDGERHFLEHVWILGAARPLIIRLDEQPIVLRLMGPAAHAHQVPFAMQFVAIEREVEMTFLEAPVRVFLGMPAAAVPNHDGTTAVFALRNCSFEFVVFDRMVLHLHRKPLLAGNETRAARDRPALHDTVELEPQIVMQPARRVFLDEELVALAARRAPARLRRHVKLALLAIELKAHGRRPQLARLSFLRLPELAGCAAAPLRATLPRLACTLRRNASIRFTTLPGCGGGARGARPARFAAINALSAVS